MTLLSLLHCENFLSQEVVGQVLATPHINLGEFSRSPVQLARTHDANWGLGGPGANGGIGNGNGNGNGNGKGSSKLPATIVVQLKMEEIYGRYGP